MADSSKGITIIRVFDAPVSDAAFEAMKKSRMEEGWNQSLDKLAESLK